MEKVYKESLINVSKILEDRNKIDGDPIKLHNEIASMWTIILKKEITALQVVMAMQAVKLCRKAAVNHYHLDSWDDEMGYTAIGRVIAEKELQNFDK